MTNTVIYADEANDALDDYTLGAVSFEQTLDRRNDLLSPTKGYFLNWQGDVASRYLAGEVSFLRLSVQATWYLPLRQITQERPFVPFIILNHRAGLMVPYDNTTTAPIPERFFLGGPDTVRSFQLDGLGPKDQNGYPVGGMAYLLGNAEIQWPIWRALYVAGLSMWEISRPAWSRCHGATPGSGRGSVRGFIRPSGITCGLRIQSHSQGGRSGRGVAVWVWLHLLRNIPLLPGGWLVRK